MKLQKRRGSLFDMVWLTVAAFSLVLGVIVLYYVGHAVHLGIPADVLNSGPNGAASDPFLAFENLNGLLDGLVIFVVIASGIGSAVLARNVNQNPGFWVLGIIFIGIMNVVWMALHDVLIGIMASVGFSSTSNHFPLISIFVTYFPLWMIALSVIIAWATWGKTQNSYQGY